MPKTSKATHIGRGPHGPPTGHVTIALEIVTTIYDEVGVFAGAEETIGGHIDEMMANCWENGDKLGKLTIDLSKVDLGKRLTND